MIASLLKPHLALLAASLAWMSGGCGDDGGGLGGTAVDIYDMAYDTVLIQRQEEGGVARAMVINYLRGGGAEKPLKVVVPFPLETGVAKSLTGADSSVELNTVKSGYIKFNVTEGRITFDELGSVGETAAGEFFATFDSGATLNGSFSGTVQRLSFE